MFSFCCTDKTTDAKMMKAGGTEIGKTLAEKSRGLFSANDWQCKTYVFMGHCNITVVDIVTQMLEIASQATDGYNENDDENDEFCFCT